MGLHQAQVLKHISQKMASPCSSASSAGGTFELFILLMFDALETQQRDFSWQA